jgi:hypothetical protein
MRQTQLFGNGNSQTIHTNGEEVNANGTKYTKEYLESIGIDTSNGLTVIQTNNKLTINGVEITEKPKPKNINIRLWLIAGFTILWIIISLQ